jgi:hypothetical protein
MYVINESAIRRRARRLGYLLERKSTLDREASRSYRLVFEPLDTIAVGEAGGVGLEEVSDFLHRRKTNPLSVPLDASPAAERQRVHKHRSLSPLIAADGEIRDAFTAAAERHGLDRPSYRGRWALRKFHTLLDRQNNDRIREARSRMNAPMLDRHLPKDLAAKWVREAACRIGVGVPKMSKERAAAEGARAVYDTLPPVQRRAADILTGSRIKPRKDRTEMDALRIVDRVRSDMAGCYRRPGRPRGSSHLPRQDDASKEWTLPPPLVMDKVEAALSALEILTGRSRQDLFPKVQVSTPEFHAVLACAGRVGLQDLDVRYRQDEIRVIARLIRASLRETRGA